MRGNISYKSASEAKMKKIILAMGYLLGLVFFIGCGGGGVGSGFLLPQE